MAFALDCASSEMYDFDSRTYELNEERVTAEELIDHTREGYRKAVQTISSSPTATASNGRCSRRPVRPVGERIEKLSFLLRVAERIPNCSLADVPAIVKF
jgi:hypothetical protein